MRRYQEEKQQEGSLLLEKLVNSFRAKAKQFFLLNDGEE
jgi:hypothetical protein